MNKHKEKHIGLICQNETLFQNLFNKIYLNLRYNNSDYIYNFITFSDTKTLEYDYIILVDKNTNYEINYLRHYINYHNTISIINTDIIDCNSIANLGDIVSYGFNSNSDYIIKNIYQNNKLNIFNLEFNDSIRELYCIIYNKEELLYIVSILLLLLNERYKFDDIKYAIQKVGH